MPSPEKPKSKWDQLKDILQESADSGSKDIDDAIESGNYSGRPTDNASARGLVAAAKALGVASNPSPEEREEYIQNLKENNKFKGAPEYSEEDYKNMPMPYPAIMGELTPEVEGTKLGKMLNLKAGMSEDAAVKNALEQGAEGTALAHGAGIADEYGSSNIDKVAKMRLDELDEQPIKPSINKLNILNPSDYRNTELKNNLEAGTSKGFYDPESKTIALNRYEGPPEEVLSTLNHEIQHAIENGTLTPEKLAKLTRGYSDNLQKGKSLSDYSSEYNDLVHQGKFSEAARLENEIKKNHFAKYDNYELENFLSNLNNYSKDATPEDVDLISKISPKFKNTFLKNKK